MAKIIELTPDRQAEFDLWVASRPPVVQELIRQLPPDRLYRLKVTGQRGPIVAYNENSTVSMAITGEHNFVTHDRNVFGIRPEDLEECDLPSRLEKLGTFLVSEEEVKGFVEMIKKGDDAATREYLDRIASERKRQGKPAYSPPRRT